jgi:hypothetical protein
MRNPIAEARLRLLFPDPIEQAVVRDLATYAEGLETRLAGLLSALRDSLAQHEATIEDLADPDSWDGDTFEAALSNTEKAAQVARDAIAAATASET